MEVPTVEMMDVSANDCTGSSVAVVDEVSTVHRRRASVHRLASGPSPVVRAKSTGVAVKVHDIEDSRQKVQRKMMVCPIVA